MHSPQKITKRIGLNKQNICKSQMGQDQVPGRVSVPCPNATPIEDVTVVNCNRQLNYSSACWLQLLNIE